MKSFLAFLALILFTTIGFSQQINQAEYFFDSHVAPGSGTALVVNSQDTLDTNFSISTTGLAVGFHTLHIRVKENGKPWSLHSSQGFYIAPPQLSTFSGAVVEGRSFIDSIGAGITTFSINSQDTVDSVFSISTAGLSAGFHTLHFQVRDPFGQWSLHESASFFVAAPSLSANAAPLQSIEFFVDSDPGVGNGLALGFVATDTLDSTMSIAPGTLSFGQHVLYARVADANGNYSLQAHDTFTVYSPPSANLTANTISCFGNSDGWAKANAIGLSPLQFLWSSGTDTTDSIGGLMAGIYTVTVTDGTGATFVDSIEIISPAVLSSLVVVDSNSGCGGSQTGGLSASTTGGTPPYSYTWSIGGQTSSITGLGIGTYSVTLTDANQCQAISQGQVIGSGNTCAEITSPNCGDTLSSFGQRIYYTSISGATNYRYQITSTGFSTIYARGFASDNFNLSQVSGILLNTTYSIAVAAFVNGAWEQFGPACSITTPATSPTTQLSGNDCNSTLANLNEWLYINPVPGATDYRYRVSAVGFSQVFTRGYQWSNFRMDFISGIAYNTIYNVEVAAFVGGSWGIYGPVCTVTTPAVAPLTQLITPQCNYTLSSWTEYLYYNQVPGADNYRVEVSNVGLGFNTVYVRGYQWTTWRMDWVFSNFLSNTTYNVRVAASINNVWEPYGPVCTLTTPGMPQPRLFTKQNGESSINKSPGYLLFPNPTNSYITLQTENTNVELIAIRIYDLKGRLVGAFSADHFNEEHSMKIDLTSLKNGLYLLQMVSNESSRVVKVIKE